MKIPIKRIVHLLALTAGFGSMQVGPTTAQTLRTLYSFSGTNGANPYSGLTISSNILYGTTQHGGGSTAGTLFKVNIDGTGFTTLHSFATGAENAIEAYTNSDGAFPNGLILLSDRLFGTTYAGGTSGNGTVFAINSDGSNFTTLHEFANGDYGPMGYTNSDGVGPTTLVLSENTLYGTAYSGGSSEFGTVFKLNIDGTGFHILHSFTNGLDGAYPVGVFISQNTLYGAASGGGASQSGTVFKTDIEGMNFAAIYSFTAASGEPPYLTNVDGAGPKAGVILSGTTLYGTTANGGSSGYGTLFAVNTNGTCFTNLHSFGAVDGAEPFAPLTISGDTLYGTTTYGGTAEGTVFEVNTDGTEFTTLCNFSNNDDGGFPRCNVVLSANTLYGTAPYGGSFGSGTVFSIALQVPELSIIHYDGEAVLTWPIRPGGLSLQSTTNLSSSAIWTTNSLVPVTINGQNTVTNRISSTQQFFRLAQ